MPVAELRCRVADSSPETLRLRGEGGRGQQPGHRAAPPGPGRPTRGLSRRVQVRHGSESSSLAIATLRYPGTVKRRPHPEGGGTFGTITAGLAGRHPPAGIATARRSTGPFPRLGTSDVYTDWLRPRQLRRLRQLRVRAARRRSRTTGERRGTVVTTAGSGTTQRLRPRARTRRSPTAATEPSPSTFAAGGSRFYDTDGKLVLEDPVRSGSPSSSLRALRCPTTTSS